MTYLGYTVQFNLSLKNRFILILFLRKRLTKIITVMGKRVFFLMINIYSVIIMRTYQVLNMNRNN